MPWQATYVARERRQPSPPGLVYHRAPCACRNAKALPSHRHREVIMEGIALLVGPSLVIFGALAWVMSLFKEQAALDAERDQH
jgi:hypothetical protein